MLHYTEFTLLLTSLQQHLVDYSIHNRFFGRFASNFNSYGNSNADYGANPDQVSIIWNNGRRKTDYYNAMKCLGCILLTLSITESEMK